MTPATRRAALTERRAILRLINDRRRAALRERNKHVNWNEALPDTAEAMLLGELTRTIKRERAQADKKARRG